MRANALSDDKVIEVVNEHLIPLEINVTTDGLPVQQIPALKPVEVIYHSNFRTEFGFASCLIVEPEGRYLLGSSAMHRAADQLDVEGAFSAKGYLDFIVTSLERYKKCCAIKELPPLQRIGAWKDLLVEIVADTQKSVQSMARLQQSFNR